MCFMLAVPKIGNIQCSPGYAAPEVITHYVEPDSQAVKKKQIDFQAQDMWSLGCLLVWLMFSETPFAVRQEDAAKAKKNVFEMVHMKQNLWVSTDKQQLDCTWFAANLSFGRTCRTPLWRGLLDSLHYHKTAV